MSHVNKVLWTGGWDSTFRILYLVISEEEAVQPYYVVDPFRWSLVQELQAMSRIRQALGRRFPKAEGLLLPTRMIDKTSLQPDREISESYAPLRNRLGGQYEWLAMWAKQAEIKDVELVIEKTDSKLGCLPVVGRYLKKTDKGLVVDDAYAGYPEHVLFQYFLFTITDLSKLDMLRLAAVKGFDDLLGLTWFCHRPKFFSLPCGTCNPCKSTKHKGLGYRLGLYGNIMYHLDSFFDIKKHIKSNSKIYAMLKKYSS